jgi:hypothetical protein
VKSPLLELVHRWWNSHHGVAVIMEDQMRSRAGKHAGGPDLELDLTPGPGHYPMLSHRTDEIGQPFDSQKKTLQ